MIYTGTYLYKHEYAYNIYSEYFARIVFSAQRTSRIFTLLFQRAVLSQSTRLTYEHALLPPGILRSEADWFRNKLGRLNMRMECFVFLFPRFIVVVAYYYCLRWNVVLTWMRPVWWWWKIALPREIMISISIRRNSYWYVISSTAADEMWKNNTRRLRRQRYFAIFRWPPWVVCGRIVFSWKLYIPHYTQLHICNSRWMKTHTLYT